MSDTVDRVSILPPTCRSKTGSPGNGCGSASMTKSDSPGPRPTGVRGWSSSTRKGWFAELVGPGGRPGASVAQHRRAPGPRPRTRPLPAAATVPSAGTAGAGPDPGHDDGRDVTVGDGAPVPRVDALVGIVAEQPPGGSAAAAGTPLHRALDRERAVGEPGQHQRARAHGPGVPHEEQVAVAQRRQHGLAAHPGEPEWRALGGVRNLPTRTTRHAE